MQEQSFSINSDNGTIEAKLHIPNDHFPTINIVCHPHTEYGGTMDNKVVTTIIRASTQSKIVSIRFNFRGAGNSQGTFDNGNGEQHDLLAVVNYVKQKFPNYKIILSGFSFGTFVAFKLSGKLANIALILAAPAVNKWNYQNNNTINIPTLIIHGTNDEIADCKQAKDWAIKNLSDITFIEIAAAEHFFHGKLVELHKAISEFISKQLTIYSFNKS